jgi:hypothetical protein
MAIRFAAILAAALLTGSGALAESGHDHDAKHGGLVAESGHHHVELVAKDGTLEFYITHADGSAEEVTGATATATVLSGGKKSDVPLAAGSGNVLKGTGDFKAAPGTVVVLTLRMPDHEPEQARFKLD